VHRRTGRGAGDVKVEQSEGLPMLDIAYAQDRASRLGVPCGVPIAPPVNWILIARRAGVAASDR